MKKVYGIVKSYKKGDFELIISQSHVGFYNFTKLVGNDQSLFQSYLEYEDAEDCFDYWLEENEAKKEEELK